MVQIPKLKKKINSFLTKEDGKITKQALIKGGILLGSTILMTHGARADCPLASPGDQTTHNDHCNTLDLKNSAPSIVATHGHATHSSHSQHSSGAWC